MHISQSKRATSYSESLNEKLHYISTKTWLSFINIYVINIRDKFTINKITDITIDAMIECMNYQKYEIRS